MLERREHKDRQLDLLTWRPDGPRQRSFAFEPFRLRDAPAGDDPFADLPGNPTSSDDRSHLEWDADDLDLVYQRLCEIDPGIAVLAAEMHRVLSFSCLNVAVANWSGFPGRIRGGMCSKRFTADGEFWCDAKERSDPKICPGNGFGRLFGRLMDHPSALCETASRRGLLARPHWWLRQDDERILEEGEKKFDPRTGRTWSGTSEWGRQEVHWRMRGSIVSPAWVYRALKDHPLVTRMCAALSQAEKHRYTRRGGAVSQHVWRKLRAWRKVARARAREQKKRGGPQTLGERVAWSRRERDLATRVEGPCLVCEGTGVWRRDYARLRSGTAPQGAPCHTCHRTGRWKLRLPRLRTGFTATISGQKHKITLAQILSVLRETTGELHEAIARPFSLSEKEKRSKSMPRMAGLATPSHPDERTAVPRSRARPRGTLRRQRTAVPAGANGGSEETSSAATHSTREQEHYRGEKVHCPDLRPPWPVRGTARAGSAVHRLVSESGAVFETTKPLVEIRESRRGVHQLAAQVGQLLGQLRRLRPGTADLPVVDVRKIGQAMRPASPAARDASPGASADVGKGETSPTEKQLTFGEFSVPASVRRRLKGGA